MVIGVYLVLCIINALIFYAYITVDGRRNDNPNLEIAINKLYLLITFPMLAYTVYLLIYIYTRESGIYTIFVIKVFATLILGLVLLGSILKLIYIIVEKIYSYCFPLYIAMLIILMVAFILTAVISIGSSSEATEKKLLVDKIPFNSIEFKDDLAYIITDKGKEEVIIGDYALHELDRNTEGKYILKYSVKRSSETLLEAKINRIKYEYIIYTDDANEYADLYMLYKDEVIDDFIKGSI